MSAPHPQAEERASLARDPSTPPPTLQALAGDRSGQVRRLVAGNPNAPLPVLFSLLPEHTEEVVGNPALSLHLLADPLWVRKMPLEAALAAASCPSTPGWLLAQLADVAPFAYDPQAIARSVSCCDSEPVGEAGWKIDAALAWNPSTGPGALARLALSSNAPARAGAAVHPSTPGPLLALLARAGSSPTLLRTSGEHGPLTDEERTSLVDGGHWGRVLVAAHPDSPEPVRSRLIREACAALAVQCSPFPDHEGPGQILRAVARNPSTTREELAALEGPILGRSGTAASPARLSQLWIAEARSSRTRPERLEQLAKHGDKWIGALVAGNPSTPGRRLLELAWRGYMGAIENPTLERLLSADRSLLEGLYDARLEALCAHPAAPPSLLALAAHRAPAALLGHPAAARELVLAYAAGPVESLRTLALEHPALAYADRKLLSRALRGRPLSAEERARLSAMGPWARARAEVCPSRPLQHDPT